jgi:predicted RNA binding protein YcfA (HicA-like mRNA interferase family)
MNPGRLPILSGAEVLKALGKIGYTVNDQKGSHIHLRHEFLRPITIPNHPEIARGTLKAIIHQADLNIEEFLDLL